MKRWSEKTIMISVVFVRLAVFTAGLFMAYGHFTEAVTSARQMTANQDDLSTSMEQGH